MSIQEVKEAIFSLSPDELKELEDWLETQKEIRSTRWDNQIESDINGGKLDALAAEARGTNASSRTRPL